MITTLESVDITQKSFLVCLQTKISKLRQTSFLEFPYLSDSNEGIWFDNLPKLYQCLILLKLNRYSNKIIGEWHGFEGGHISTFVRKIKNLRDQASLTHINLRKAKLADITTFSPNPANQILPIHCEVGIVNDKEPVRIFQKRQSRATANDLAISLDHVEFSEAKNIEIEDIQQKLKILFPSMFLEPNPTINPVEFYFLAAVLSFETYTQPTQNFGFEGAGLYTLKKMEFVGYEFG
jgi:hypothetical protein